MGELVYNNGFCGLEIDYHDDMDRLLAFHLDADFTHYVFTPLVDPAYKHSLSEKDIPHQRKKIKLENDIHVFAGHWVLSTREWSNRSNRLVGKISSWIDLDSDDEMLRRDSEIALREEILQNLCSMQLLIRIPLVPDDEHGGEKLNYMGELQTDSLELWRHFHRLCELEFHNRLSVAFDFLCSLPSANSLQRWSDEPVRAAIINSKTFLKGQCLWSSCEVEHHRKAMMWLFKHSVKMVLAGTPVPDVHPEILSSSATNANNHEGDYRPWHPLQLKMAHIISFSGFISYHKWVDEYTQVKLSAEFDDDDEEVVD